MDYAEFMVGLTEYYGKYKNEFVEKIVLKYVKANFREDDLQSVFNKVLAQHSSDFKRPPDVALFEKILSQNDSRLETEALLHWTKINNKVNSYSDIFFESPKLQAVIEGMGGWVHFCQRPNAHEAEVWARKRFIELYKLYSKENPMIDHKILRGLSGCCQLIKYGDQKRCNELIAGQENTMESKVLGIAAGMIKKI